MSTYTIDKIEYGGDVYRLQDSVSDYITGIGYQDVIDALGYTPTDNVGTVTSITLTQGTGISINSSGVAITNSGSRTISLATITKSDSTSTVSPAHGETFTAIDSITYDTYGRVTGVNTKTITLPADSNTDTLVAQTNTTNNLEYRLLFSANANDNDETDISRKNTYLRYNPYKKALISSGEIRANKGVFNQLVATSANFDSATITDLTAQNATVVGLLDVQGQLHSNSWTNANIANIGGSFYITPTIESASGTISITRNVSNNIVSWSVQIIGAFATDFIKSGTETAGVNWPSGSLVLLTGNIILNDMEYPLGTLQGTLSSQVNADNTGVSKTLTITGIKDGQNSSTNASPVLQRLYELNGNANIIGASFSNGKISLYKLGNYPIGIQMSSMGTNSNSLIEIYGGISTNPTVRIGHLAGLPNVNGSAPTGWGIYTDNGYFTGVIVSTAGKIGGFDIGQTDLHNGTLAGTNSVWVSTGTSGSAIIGGSELINNWAFTASDKFGVTKGGDLWANSAHIDGNITARSITIANNATIVDENALISNSAIETGGRNLLRNTGSEGGYRNGATPSDLTLAIGEEDGYYKTLDTSASWIDSGSSCTFVTSSQVAVETLVKNKFYTLSMYVRSTVARSYRLQLRIADENSNVVEDNGNLNIGTDEQVTFALEANTWTKISRTFKVPNDVIFYSLTSDTTIDNNKTYYTRSGSQGAYTYSVVGSPNVNSLGTYYERFEDDIPVYARLLYGPSNNECIIYVKEWKLERGNQDTDWVPAVEDMAGKDEIEKIQVDSVNGAIVEFEANTAYPLLNGTVFIEPIQPNNYDSVWVGGAGKNKINASDISAPSTSNTEYTATLASATYVISFDIVNATRTNLANTSFVNIIDGNSNNNYITGAMLKNIATDETLNSAGANINGRYYYKYTGSISKVTFLWRSNSYAALTAGKIEKIQIEVGSSPTAFAPYENICPISGHTEANVSRTGVNVWDGEYESGSIDGSTGANEVSSSNWRSKNYVRIEPNRTYYIASSSSGKAIRARFYGKYKNYIGYVDGNGYNVYTTSTFKAPSNAYYIRFAPANADIPNHDISINYPSTDTSYHAYNGDTYNISFSTAGTVYGGTLDVTTGVLTVTHEIVDLGTLPSWTSVSISGNGNRFFSADLQNIIDKPTDTSVKPDIMCSGFPVKLPSQYNQAVQGITIYTNGAIQVYDASLSSLNATEFTFAVSGITLVYPLVTPQIYNLTLTEINTLIGHNIIWSDAGNISITYANFSENLQQTLTNIRNVSSSQLNVFSQETEQRFGWTDEQISMARTVATNYIDAFTTDGIYIHNIRDEQHPDNPSIYISNSQIDLIRNGKSQVVISNDGLSIYNAIAGDTEPIAQYGAETIIGKAKEPHVQIKNNKLSFYEGRGTIPDAYLGDNSLYINRTITTEVAIGSVSSTDSTTGETRLVPNRQWSWKVHNNLSGQNNLGLRWGG